MSDEDALLAKMRENPADDTVRLVYADWLDENDRLDWAEFLRLECEVRSGGDLTRLREVGDPLPFDWLAAVSRPALLGTTWVDPDPLEGESEGGDLEVYRFDPSGVLQYGDEGFGSLRPQGEWRQVGPWVRCSINHFMDGRPCSFFDGPVREDRLDLRMTWRHGGEGKLTLLPTPPPAAGTARSHRPRR